MNRFIISGFADEISQHLEEQMNHLDTLGIKYIEARGIDGKNIADITEEEALVIAERLKTRGFKLSALGSPIGKSRISADFEIELARFRHVLKLAKILDTDKIRIFSFYPPENGNIEDYRDEVLRRLQVMAEEARDSGILLLHENEKGIYGQTPKRCLDIFESVKADNLYAVFDPANFVQAGCDTKSAADMLLPYIKYVHIKDALPEGNVVPSGYGAGNVEYVLRLIAGNGFSGFLSLEPHLSKFEGFEALEQGDNKLTCGESAEKFTLAFNCLKKIIDRI